MKKMLNNLLTVAIVAVIAITAITAVGTIKDMKSSDKKCDELMAQANIPQHEEYALHGRYDGLFSWEDERGHTWRYRTAEVTGIEVYEGMPVIIYFDDNATPDNIYDDEVIGILYDRETAIYDDLETSLSESFELEREGNNIRIQSLKEVK